MRCRDYLRLLVLLTIISIGNLLNAQTEENILQTLEDMEISGEDAERILEAIEQRNNNHIKYYNINEMNREDMLLLGLSNFQIFCLENYILRTGQLYSLNELSFVNGFDSITITKIRPYLYVEPIKRKYSLRLDSIFARAKHSVRFQYVQNLKDSYGFTRTDGKGYEGDNFSSSIRYNMKYYDRMEFSLIGEKDYGEPLYRTNKIYGYDHYSMSLTLRDLTKHLKQITLGDFRLNIGEGLAMKQSFSLSYLSAGYGTKHSNNIISPFRSTMEYNFNRGIATKFEWKNFELTTFASYNKIDFNGKSIQETGYHRTEREIMCKDSNSVMLAGGTLQYYNKGFNIGLTAFAYHYADSIKRGTQNYQCYNFEGKDNNIISLNTSYSYKNIIFFMEMARSMNNAFSELLGLQIDFSYKTILSIVARNYDKKYQNYYADALGYHSHNQNERGIYVDYSHYINKRFSYFAGVDVYYFPFMSYRADTSSYGAKAKVQMEYKLSDKHIFNVYFRFNSHQYNVTKSLGQKELEDDIVMQWHMKYKYSHSHFLTFASKAGYSRSFTYDSHNNNGYYVYMEMIAKPFRQKLSINLRYTYFHTSDYDNRFYIYEYALPLSYSSTMLYRIGHRINTVLSFRPTNKLQIHLRYHLTKYNNISEIGTGNDLIKGNIRHYIGGQIFLKF